MKLDQSETAELSRALDALMEHRLDRIEEKVTEVFEDWRKRLVSNNHDDSGFLNGQWFVHNFLWADIKDALRELRK